MTLYTSSRGILAKQATLEACFEKPLSMLSKTTQLLESDTLVGWGLKANTQASKHKAKELGLDFLHLEDGFIGYAGHPANKAPVLSVVSDNTGIYYDARQPSQLETLIRESVSIELLERAKQLIEKVTLHGITKYNCYANLDLPVNIQKQCFDSGEQTILIVDQVAGDLSVKGAMATEADFTAMVAHARINYPNAKLLLRTHPDTRFGKKKGILGKMNLDDVKIVDQHCHPHALLMAVDIVYTVSSQMGFEGLLLGRPVHCFGMPFYAGWGLTQDQKSCSRRTPISLEQLVAGSLIQYPKYYNPILKQRCEVEDIVALIANQYYQKPEYDKLYLVGFSLWKRAFISKFCAHLANKLVFVKQLPKQLKANERVVVWGAKYPDLISCIRIEDGFIRSSGLGSNLCRPSSLSIDPDGIYFNNQRPSKLENLLNNELLNAEHKQRGAELISLLKKTRVSKYNVGKNVNFIKPNNNKKLILVVGQVDGDASILTGSNKIQSNEQLLWSVRENQPDAHIIFKPHPDVVAGNRSGEISNECQQKCVDNTLVDVELATLFEHIDELHTMTSLSGFEALVQGVNVVTWGQPFYSGWGLTHDMNPPQRRSRSVDLSTLVYLTLAEYPNYIDWQTGLKATPEEIITLVARQGTTDVVAATQLKRWLLKATYLLQTIKH